MIGEPPAGPRNVGRSDCSARTPRHRPILESRFPFATRLGQCARRRVVLAGAVVLALLGGCAVPPAAGPQAGAAAQAGASAASAAAPSESAGLAAAAAPAAPIVTYDPQRPSQPYEFDAATANTDLFDRVRAGFAMPNLDGELVAKWEQWYATRPDYVQRMTERGSRYLYYVVEEIERRGLPTELALLPFIESAFNPHAKSSARAAGMWQFMPATGRDFDLKQNLFRDERRDVLQSTRAALDYLQLLQTQFDDWQLTLAAYNWGQGNVQRAVDRNRKAGRPTTYEALRMPEETRNYVPKLQAVKNIVLRPQAYALELPRIENHPYFLSVPITRDIDVALAARFAGVSIEEFRQLNPQLNKPVILAAGTPQVLLPFENAGEFARKLNGHDGVLATWTAWVAPATLKPAEAARRIGISEAELRAANQIPPRMLIKTGSTLLVPRNGRHDADVPDAIADNATVQFAPDRPPGKRITVRAGKSGLSVAAVARRYGVSAEQVAQWNAVEPDARFKAGQRIVVYRPVKARTARARDGEPAQRAARAGGKRAVASAGGKARHTAAAKTRPAAAQTTRSAQASGKSSKPARTAAKAPPARPVASSDDRRGAQPRL